MSDKIEKIGEAGPSRQTDDIICHSDQELLTNSSNRKNNNLKEINSENIVNSQQSNTDEDIDLKQSNHGAVKQKKTSYSPKKTYKLELDPRVRRRTQNRLLKKLKSYIDEYIARVGEQMVLIQAPPHKGVKVFGAQPLDKVVKSYKCMISDNLQIAMAQETPQPQQVDENLFVLPPLIFDGVPVPFERMLQSQLRSFIPLMLKFSTQRGIFYIFIWTFAVIYINIFY